MKTEEEIQKINTDIMEFTLDQKGFERKVIQTKVRKERPKYLQPRLYIRKLYRIYTKLVFKGVLRPIEEVKDQLHHSKIEILRSDNEIKDGIGVLAMRLETIERLSNELSHKVMESKTENVSQIFSAKNEIQKDLKSLKKDNDSNFTSIANAEIKSLNLLNEVVEKVSESTNVIQQLDKIKSENDEINNKLRSVLKEVEEIQLNLKGEMDKVIHQNFEVPSDYKLGLEISIDNFGHMGQWLKTLNMQIDNRSRDMQALLFNFRKELLVEMNKNANLAGGIDEVDQKIINQQKVENLNPRKLNVGCGLDIRDDYLNIDARELNGVDIVAEAADLPLDTGSVDEILASHLLEHFTEVKVEQILTHWFKLLKSGGKIVAILPDIQSMMDQYQRGEITWDELRRIVFGDQDYVGDFHYNMYSVESFESLVRKVLEKAEVKLVQKGRKNGDCLEFEIHIIK